MDNDLTRFLTEGETKQISEIISRAEKRKKGREERGGEVDNILESVKGKVLLGIALASDKIGLI